jgi:predicted nucleic acid-binding protein
VAAWAGRVPSNSFYLSAITVMELEVGVLQIERRDRRQGGILRDWLENTILANFSGRVLPVDTPVARRCAALHVPDRRSERDALIAATALVHRMAVVTRNTADFAATGVKLLNPWAPAPA